MSKSRRIYWDACVFISYLEETSGRLEHIDAIMTEISKSPTSIIFTSVITQVEVAQVYGDAHILLSDEDAEQALERLWMDDSVIELVELHPGIARTARDLMRKAKRMSIGGLRANDAIHLATAIYVNANEINSYESKWQERFSQLVDMPIREPTANQPSLL